MSLYDSCPEEAQLRRLLDGRLPEADVAQLAGHFDDCLACRARLDGLIGLDRGADFLAARLRDRSLAASPALRQVMADLRDPPSGGAAPTTPPAPPPTLGHYEVRGLIGQGGMGRVYQAFDPTLHRVVAIKVMSDTLAGVGSARQRFLREARAAAAITHDNVVTIHAVEDVGALPYIVMQYVPGRSLQDRLDRDGPLPPREILRIGLQTAAGLAAAHAQGIVHRDVKPGNILLENGIERVKLTDFGLARAADDASLTQSGVLTGTPAYMSPEQANGEALDHRSDLFSLGSVLYALCTGRPPFRAAGTLAVLRRVCEDTPRPIREINPDIPDWLCDLVARLQAKAPAERFQTAREVADLLAQHLARLQQPALAAPPVPVPVPAPPPPPRPAPRPRARQNRSYLRLLLPVVGLAVVYLLLGLANARGDNLAPAPSWLLLAVLLLAGGAVLAVLPRLSVRAGPGLAVSVVWAMPGAVLLLALVLIWSVLLSSPTLFLTVLVLLVLLLVWLVVRRLQPAPGLDRTPRRGQHSSEVPEVPAGDEQTGVVSERYRKVLLITRLKQLAACHKAVSWRQSVPFWLLVLQGFGVSLLPAVLAGGLAGSLTEDALKPPAASRGDYLPGETAAWRVAREQYGRERDRAELIGHVEGVAVGLCVVAAGVWVRLRLWSTARAREEKALADRLADLQAEFPEECQSWGGRRALMEAMIAEEVLRELESSRAGER